jgi:hypothetical protein
MTRIAFPLWFTPVFILAGITAADGQTGSARTAGSLPPAEPAVERITVSTVRIKLTGVCKPPAEVLVVADDVDVEIPPRPNKDGLLIFDTVRFNARKGHVSLRMGPKPWWRTDCHQATEMPRRDDPEPLNRQHWVALFQFSGCPDDPVQPVHQVSIHTEPPEASVSVRYVRELGGIKGSSVDCAEGELLRRPINDVQYKREKLHLQIAPNSPNPKACGFVVNDPVARKYAKPSTDELVVFEKTAVVDALRELRSKAKVCSGPSFSLAASKLDFKNLDDANLTKLSMTVKPQPEPVVK